MQIQLSLNSQSKDHPLTQTSSNNNNNNANTVPLTIEDTSTLATLIELSARTLGLSSSIDGLAIKHQRRLLIDKTRTLQDYSIQSGDLITLVDRRQTTASCAVTQPYSSTSSNPSSIASSFATSLAPSQWPYPSASMQRYLEQELQQIAIDDNLAKALEWTPEAFVPVEMLWIPCQINGSNTSNGTDGQMYAFVDTGAQKSVMSPEMAEACGIARLMDRRFSGVAVGVGTAKIVGSVHSVPLKLGNSFYPLSVHIVEGLASQGNEFILGLDFLRGQKVSSNHGILRDG